MRSSLHDAGFDRYVRLKELMSRGQLGLFGREGDETDRYRFNSLQVASSLHFQHQRPARSLGCSLTEAYNQGPPSLPPSLPSSLHHPLPDRYRPHDQLYALGSAPTLILTWQYSLPSEWGRVEVMGRPGCSSKERNEKSYADHPKVGGHNILV